MQLRNGDPRVSRSLLTPIVVTTLLHQALTWTLGIYTKVLTPVQLALSPLSYPSPHPQPLPNVFQMTKFLEVESRLAVGAAGADEKRVALGEGRWVTL